MLPVVLGYTIQYPFWILMVCGRCVADAFISFNNNIFSDDYIHKYEMLSSTIIHIYIVNPRLVTPFRPFGEGQYLAIQARQVSL